MSPYYKQYYLMVSASWYESTLLQPNPIGIAQDARSWQLKQSSACFEAKDRKLVIKQLVD